MSFGRAIFFGSTLLLWAFVLGSLLSVTAPPSLLLASFLLAAYVGVIVVGALVPSLEMYGEVLSRVELRAPLVALTFDDGPDPATTPRVLDELKQRGHRATFFVIGRKVEAHPELIRRMLAEGHGVGIHSYGHPWTFAFLSPEAVRQDLERCRALLVSLGAPEAHWFRPPVGIASPRTFEGVRRAKALVAGWSVRPRDGVRGRPAEEVLQVLRKKTVPGSIVLLHDAWETPEPDETGPVGASALPALLGCLDELGLSSVTLDELVERGSRE